MAYGAYPPSWVSAAPRPAEIAPRHCRGRRWCPQSQVLYRVWVVCWLARPEVGRRSCLFSPVAETSISNSRDRESGIGEQHLRSSRRTEENGPVLLWDTCFRHRGLFSWPGLSLMDHSLAMTASSQGQPVMLIFACTPRAAAERRISRRRARCSGST